MVCHNSRRGLYNDQAMPRTNHRVTHETASTDVLVGRTSSSPGGGNDCHCNDLRTPASVSMRPKQDA
jgi:hypothetical protein